MECLFPFLLILALFIAVTMSLATRSGKSRKRQSYQQIAKRFAGAYQSGGLFRHSSVLMRYGPTRAVLREATSQGPYQVPCTQVRIDLPSQEWACEVFPRGEEHRAPPFRRLVPLATGNADFDAALVVRGQRHRAEDLPRLFSDGVRWQLHRLLAIGDDQRLYVRLYRGQLCVQKPMLIRRYDTLAEFVGISLDLYDQLMLTQAEGIDFLSDAHLQTLDEVICTVCGEQVGADMVYCRRCKTPHHSDCWQFNGGCAIYGCRETEFLRPRSGAPTGKPR